MFDLYYTRPFFTDEHFQVGKWMPLPDGRGKDRQIKCDIREVADGVKAFFETHLERQVNISVTGDPTGYILISIGHFAYCIGQLLKNIANLECPHLNIEIGDIFKIIITFNYEMPIPKNIVDIAIAAEHSGLPMHMEGDNLVFEAKMHRPKIVTLYQPRLYGFKQEFARAVLLELNRK